MNNRLLSYECVDVSYNGQTVVQDISFDLYQGEILGIVGESGSGKSTLLKAGMGLLGNTGLVTRGDIWFENQDIPDLCACKHIKVRGVKVIGKICS